ncbi:acyl-CoA dehydrogenase family protein [Xanthobacter dioxanivorans]|nr:acyl-CoA dehydrogenase family protein [Xanthobacter dioxanivorans]
MFRDTVRRFAENEVAPVADKIDREDKIPETLVARMGELGLLQIAVPEEFGGPGGNIEMTCIAKEEVARHSAAASHYVGATSIAMALPIAAFGTPAQKARYLPEVATGKVVSAIALTEPQTGSDVSGIKTTARRDGDDYIIRGQKIYITKAAKANYILTFARTSEDPYKGISSFIVPTTTPGIEIAKGAEKLGLRGIDNNTVFYDDVRVPAENMLGEEGRGFLNAMTVLNFNRPTVGAAAVGVAQGALDAAIAYAKERIQFGRPIADFQAIQHLLAEMALQIQAARGLVRDAARVSDARGDMKKIATMSSMAKTFASDVCMKVTIDAVQVFGGAGFFKDHPVERMMRDAKIFQIYEGTNQIQRNIIAKNILA